MTTLLSNIASIITSVMSWCGKVVDALFTTDGALADLLPLFLIGIAVSAVLLGIRVMRSLIWGA